LLKRPRQGLKGQGPGSRRCAGPEQHASKPEFRTQGAGGKAHFSSSSWANRL
jgi:hypothetical protein